MLGVQATTVKSNLMLDFNCHKDSGIVFQFGYFSKHNYLEDAHQCYLLLYN